MDQRIVILGAGSWGTAIAQRLSEAGHEVTLWDLFTEHLEEVAHEKCNTRYHPGIKLNSNIKFQADLPKAIHQKNVIMMITPSHGFRPLLERIKPHLSKDAFVMTASKGLDTKTLQTLSEITSEIMGDSFTQNQYAVLSGPTFAKEVMENTPSAATIASYSEDTAKHLQELVHGGNFRIYTSTDVIGVELAGALKNVIAITTGVSDGFHFGHNARAALITRGLFEISEIGIKKGANPRTFSGLSGLGDLILTCTGDLSRNRRAGLKLAEGKTIRTIMKELGQVVEGIRTTKAAYQLAKALKVDVPIIEATYLSLYEGKSPQQAVRDILDRDPEPEHD